MNDFLPAIVVLVVLATAFLLALFFDLRRMRGVRESTHTPLTRHPLHEWPHKKATSAFTRGSDAPQEESLEALGSGATDEVSESTGM